MFFFIVFSYLSITAIFYCFLLIKEYLSPGFSGDCYKAYKLITYFIPIIILVGFFIFKDLQNDVTQRGGLNAHLKKITLIILILTLLIGNVISATTLISAYSNHPISINTNIIDLQKIGDNPDVTSVNVQEEGFWDPMWIYYFLFDKKTVYLKYQSYYPPSPQIGQWTLISHPISTDIHNIPNNSTNYIVLNPEFYIERNFTYQ